MTIADRSIRAVLPAAIPLPGPAEAPLRWSALLLVFAVVLFEVTPLDALVQAMLFDAGTGTWLLTRTDRLHLLFYQAPKAVLVLLLLFSVGALVRLRGRHGSARLRRGFRIVALSLILVPATAVLLKNTTNMPCPRDLAEFGGTLPKISLFLPLPEGLDLGRRMHCYPAGHASGGFALLSLWFLFRSPRRRRAAVSFALAVGWITGFYKMAIGDHFLGHTVVSMCLAAFMISVIAAVDRLVSAHFTPYSRATATNRSLP